MGGAFAVQVIMTVLFMPESAYHRAGAINIDSSDRYASQNIEKKIEVEHDEQSRSPARSSSMEPKKSIVRELLPYDGYWDRTSFWRTLIRPFFFLGSPMVVWATLLFTTCISWLVFISITLSQIFSAPPYNFSVGAVGATNLSSFVASVLATVISGPLVDGLAKLMAKKNNGSFGMHQFSQWFLNLPGANKSKIEPEFRLPIMTSYLIFTATGFFAWGQSLANQDPWPIPVIVCLGLINFGVQLGTTGVVTYIVDCHREQAAEAFALMNFVKNFFAFGLTFYCNDWIAIQGVRDCFFVLGGITAAVVLTTIPMYIFGKKARSWTHRHRIITKIVQWSE